MYEIDCAAEIRRRLPVKDALYRYGLDFNNKGEAKCPFHSEKTASFKIKDSVYWHCFGCQAHGDIIDFVIKYFGLEWKAALSRINDDFNLQLPINRRQTVAESLQASKRQRELERERAIKAERVESYETMLDTYAAFDCAIMRLKPKPGDTKVDSCYLYALTQIEYYKHLIRITPLPERG